MLPVAVLSPFHFESVPKGRARVLPPQLQKPVFSDWLFSFRQCSHMRPTVAVTSRLYIATAFSDVAMTLDEERVLPPQLQKPVTTDWLFSFYITIREKWIQNMLYRGKY